MKALNRSITFPLILIFLIVAPAHSASVSVSGETVDFYFDDAFTGLFGSPTFTGNSLVFNPTMFSADAINNSGNLETDMANQVFNVRVVAKDGYSLSGASLSERGQYILNNTSGGDTAVNVTGTFSAYDSNNPSASYSASIAAADAFTETNPLTTDTWEGSANLDSLGIGETSDAMVTIANVLFAKAFNFGDIASIQKHFLELNVKTVEVVAAVPIPAAIWLFGSAVAGMVAIGRRRMIV